MQLTKIEIPTGNGQILIDREELLRLRDLGLLSSNKDYLYMALEIDYPRARKNIDTELLAERWSTEKHWLTVADVLIAIGNLAKKGLLDTPKQMEINFLDPANGGEP